MSEYLKLFYESIALILSTPSTSNEPEQPAVGISESTVEPSTSTLNSNLYDYLNQSEIAPISNVELQ